MEDIIKTDNPTPIEVEEKPITVEGIDIEDPLITFSKFLKGE